MMLALFILMMLMMIGDGDDDDKSIFSILISLENIQGAFVYR